MSVNPSAPMNLGDLAQKLPTQNRWENLEDMYNECTGMFSTLLPYPQEAKKLDPIATEEEKKELQRILRNIKTDSEKYLAELNEIRARHCTTPNQPRRGMIYDTMAGEDLFDYVAIASAYRNWIENFQALILQPVEDFTVISNIIEQRLKSAT